MNKILFLGGLLVVTSLLCHVQAATPAGAKSPAVPPRPGEVFLEAFESGWANGPTSQLGPEGTYPANWDFRMHNAMSWAVTDSGGEREKVLEFSGGPHNNHWWVGGASHDVSYAAGKTLQLDAWICEATPTETKDIAYLWLATSEQNGYGFAVSRHNGDGNVQQKADNKNYAAILKFRGSTQKLGVMEFPGWATQNGDLPEDPAPVDSGSDEYLHFFLRLKQAAAGAPVEISLYCGGTDGPPVMTWTDDGTRFGEVIDLGSLTFVGISAENYQIPHAIGFDDIRVMLVPEGK